MIKPFVTTVLLIYSIIGTHMTFADDDSPSCPDFLNQEYRKLHSTETINLCELYNGKPLVIVNTASHCGFTQQFSGLESLYQKYKDKGVHVIGFASNDFLQESKDEEKAATICYENFGVTFTMISPSKVRGKKANPTFAHLAASTKSPRWNFNKYLVSNNGNAIQHFGSTVKPLNSTLENSLKLSLD